MNEPQPHLVDFRLPAQLCLYNAAWDEVQDARTGEVIGHPNNHLFFTKWFEEKVKELDWFFRERNQQPTYSVAAMVAERVFVQLVDEAKKREIILQERGGIPVKVSHAS